jgi:uncharacterized C2H2 Zn-finger protein
MISCICNVCNKEFANEYSLNRHLKKKTPCISLKCTKGCGNIFNTKRDHTRHINLKRGCLGVEEKSEYEYKCEWCNKKLSSNGNLYWYDKYSQFVNTNDGPRWSSIPVERGLSMLLQNMRQHIFTSRGSRPDPLLIYDNTVLVNNIMDDFLYKSKRST